MHAQLNNLLAAGLLALVAPAFAQTTTPDLVPAIVTYKGTLPPLVDRALLFDNPEISGAQLSPDGKFITFMKPYQGERNVWIKGVNEPFDAARPLTANDRPVPGYFWTRDAKFVLFVQDAKGDENFHVYAVDPSASAKTSDGKVEVPEPRALTSGEGVRAQIVDVPRSKPGTLYVGLNDRDPAFHDLYALDITTGKKTLIYENKDQVSGYGFDYKGDLRYATKSNDAGGTEIYRVGKDQVLTQVYDCSVDESCYPTGFAADNAHVYLVSNKGNVDRTQLLNLDLATGKTTFIEEDPLKQVDFGGLMLSDLTHKPVATMYTGDKTKIYWKDATWEKDYAFLQSKLGKEIEISIGSSTTNERKMLVSASSDVDPGTTYLFDRDKRTLDKLYSIRPELKSDHLAEMRPVRYKSSDGLEIPAYLTLPRGVEAKNLPVVVFVHGGPWGRDEWGFNAYAQFWANRGYAVLSPNFRASTGYGKSFLNAGNGEWGKLMQDDITAGVDYLVAEGIADKTRVGIMGGSYGGYATLAGLAFTPDVYAAGVDIVGPSNLITLLNSIPSYWASFKTQMFTRMADPATEEGQAWLKERSPLNAATQITKPLLVVQGANDPRVKQAEADQIVVALRDLGRPVEYLVAPDEGHGFRRPENNMAMIAASEKFFHQHLGGRYQKDMPAAVATRLAEITVDPKSVVLAQAPSEADLKSGRPKPARGLTVGTHEYDATIKVMGQEIAMKITETIEDSPEGYIVTQTMASPMTGEASDRVVVSKDGLSPKQRTAKQGPATIEMTYPDGGVKGTMTMGAQTQPIDIKLDGELFTDGGAESASIAALPLAEGYTVMLRGVDSQTQQVELKRLKVTGSEKVTVPAASDVDAFRVEVKPADGSAGESIYFIEKGGQHRVLKITSIIPAMNGAVMEQVLVK